MKKLAICLILSFTVTICFAEGKFNPFPANSGSIYEYKQSNIPDAYFFPIDKAEWNGYEVTISNWGKLTDFQKASFISEGMEELVDKGQIKEQKIDGWRMIMALNHMSSSMNGLEPNLAMIAVLRDVLVEE